MTEFETLAITEPDAPSKDNFTFVGWFTDNNTFKNKFTFNLMPQSNITLYAKWSGSFEFTAIDGGYNIAQGTVTDTDIVIPSTYNDQPVIAIAPNGFSFNYDILSVVIPDSVISIANYAFYEAGNLTTVTMSANLKSIGVGAFSECVSLTSITLPDTLEILKNEAFFNCESLTSISIPSKVKIIEIQAFDGAGLESLIINEGVEEILDNAFNYCSLQNIIIPNSVNFIDSWAFNNCNIILLLFQILLQKWEQAHLAILL